ncbi:MAG: glycosyltransferase [Pseudomonadota bacterium]
MALKVQIISYSDIGGGAARAAYRLHRFLSDYGVASQMRVRSRKSDDTAVQGASGRLGRAGNALRPHLGSILGRLQRSTNASWRSGNWLPSAWAEEVDATDADVINLHWVGDETLSIEDIGRIRKPMVWTLHDMWPFCGTEHYASDDMAARWRHGYDRGNRRAGEGGLDIGRLVWLRKKRSWTRPMHVVAPSRWLANCARDSALLRNWPISVVPNPLDIGVFKPAERNAARHALGLPQDKAIILFGAAGGGSDPRKGYDLLQEALELLARDGNMPDVLCVVFGQDAPKNAVRQPFPVRWMGVVHEDAVLASLYGAADVTVVPSRQENLPQTATESQACGTPVVAFNVTGLPDAVQHEVSGYLAEPYSTRDLARGIRWVLEDSARHERLAVAARERALRLWAPEVVVPQYLSIYRSAAGQG